MIELNEYLSIFTWERAIGKIIETYLNEIIFHIITNSWIGYDYVQGFDFEAVTFNQSINMSII